MVNSKKKTISVKNTKLVWGESAGYCAKCKNRVIEKIAKGTLEPVGQLAHIEGEMPGSKRYNPNQSDNERNGHDNLILLCPNDHDLIDRDDVTYTVEVLHKMKKDHLRFVFNCIKSELPNITFAELEVVVNYLVSSDNNFTPDHSLDHITPQQKIDKNKLTNDNAILITMGMTRVKHVKEYLNNNPDVNFSERLRTKLSEYYTQAKIEESDTNILFENMIEYVSGNSVDIKKKAAAIAVMTYFFETCDIFEK